MTKEALDSLYSMIPSDRYVTRGELVRMTGWCDRTVRDGINELRKNPDTLIISSSHKKGYKKPSGVEEIESCLNESRSRSHEEWEKQRVMETALLKMKNLIDGKGQIYFDFN